MLETLFGGGLIALVVLALLAAEAILLGRWLARRGLARRYPQLLAGLTAGACLVAALGAALAGWALHWLALFMGLSLLCHVVELVLVMRRSQSE